MLEKMAQNSDAGSADSSSLISEAVRLIEKLKSVTNTGFEVEQVTAKKSTENKTESKPAHKKQECECLPEHRIPINGDFEMCENCKKEHKRWG